MGTVIVNVGQALAVNTAEWFVSGLWEAAALVLLVWAGLKLIPRTSASTRFAAWLIAFAVMVLLPFTALIPRHSVVAAATTSSAPLAPAGFTLDPRWAFAIAAAWVLASLGRFGSLLWNGYRLRKLWKDSRRAEKNAIGAELMISSGEKRRRKVELRISGQVNAPCAVGLFKPAVLIPEWLWDRLSCEELRQIMLHESAHLDRYDDWTNLLQKLAIAVFPLNPALVWMERRLCLEREMACDDAVLRAEISPKMYAACLTGLAEQRLLRRTTSLAPGAWSRQSELVRRVHGILSRDRNSSPMIAKGVAAGCMVATLGGAMAFSRAPQLVSFAEPSPVMQGADLVFPSAPVFAPQFEAGLKTVKYQPAVARQPKTAHRAVRRAPAQVMAAKPVPATRQVAALTAEPTEIPRPALVQPRFVGLREVLRQEVQEREFRQVGILQSAMTGQSWLVLSVWRSASPVRADAQNSAPAEDTTTAPARKPVPQVQTGWLLIQI